MTEPYDINQIAKDLPLTVNVKCGVLTVRIGVDTLAFADKERIEDELNFVVEDTTGFAFDVASALCHEDEIGATMLTDVLDRAMQQARDHGSAFIKHLEPKSKP